MAAAFSASALLAATASSGSPDSASASSSASSRVTRWLLQGDGEAFVEEGHFLEAASDDVELVFGSFKDVAVGPEADGGASSFGVAVIHEVFGNGVVEVLDPVVSVAPNFGFDAGGQGVNDGDTDAVQTAGDGVGVGVEFTAGVQLGHDDLHGGGAGGVHFDRDATAVVAYFDAAVFHDGDLDFVAVARHGFIDGVVDNFPDEVVEAALTGGAYVHAGAQADGFESFEDGDGICAILVFFFF